MSSKSVTVEAIFENGALHPTQPLPLAPQQCVTVTVHVNTTDDAWPDVAAVYQEIAEDDRRLAANMFAVVRETWPVIENKP